MKAWPLMLAILPLLPESAVPIRPLPSCAVAIAIDVRAPRAWGETEWHLFTGEVERTWAAYGLTFCWAQGAARCEGLEVRIRVVIADDLPVTGTTGAAPSLGRIQFRDGAPLGQIELSMAGASRLSTQARLGGRPVASWPAAIRAGLVPRVLGRGLAHEIGHFVLRSRDHSGTGLMASGFTPDAVAWGDASQFRLSEASALGLRRACR